MGIRVKVSEWGNSLAVRLPKAVADQLGLKVGDEAELVLEGNKVTLSSQKKPSRQRLEEMVAEMKRLIEAGVPEPELVDWGGDIGDEILPDEDWSAEYAAWEAKQNNAG